MKTSSSLSLLVVGLAFAGPAAAQEGGACPGFGRDGIPPGHVVIEGDIIVPEGWCQQEAPWQANPWPNGDVPYLFAPNVSATNQAQALLAMSFWEDVANVDFRPVAGDPNFVWIQDASNNSSSVGMVGGLQVINVTSWNNAFVIAHELGHCLGYFHEQSRTDQAQFVTINLQNVCQNCCFDAQGNPISCNFNFNVQPGSSSYGPYDFDSVMHYGQFAFSISPGVLPTITVLAPNQAWQSLIGQRTHLSFWDRTVMSFLYPDPDMVFVDQTAGGFNFGTFGDPYVSLGLGTTLVPSGGQVIVLEPSTYADVGVYTKAMTVRAPQGGVVIGS